MNKPLRQRSKLLHNLRCYFRTHKSKLHVLSDKQRSYLDTYVFCLPEDLPPILPSAIAIELTKSALIIRREQKKLWTQQGKRDFIEGLDIHNTHPKLYNLCLKLRIHTIKELSVFIDAIKSGSTASKEFMRQYPLIWDLISFYDSHNTNRRT